MNRKHYLLVFLLSLIITPVLSQKEKRAMTIHDLEYWTSITNKIISDDGQWVALKTAPWTGDATIHLYNSKGKETATFTQGGDMRFFPSSNYLLITQTPSKEVLDSLKRAKVKKENFPKDELLVFAGTDTVLKVDSLKSYRLSSHRDFLAYQRGGKKDSTLYINNIAGRSTAQYVSVGSYSFAKKGHAFYFVTKGDTLSFKAGLYVIGEDPTQPTLIHSGNGVYPKLAFNEEGTKLAFLYTEDKDSTDTALSLWVSENGGEATEIVDRTYAAMPEDWVLSEHGRFGFSDNSERLFFSTRPRPYQKDTTRIDEYFPKVEVWNWDEPVQYTVQKYNKKDELKRSYTAVYSFSAKEVRQLATVDLPNFSTNRNGEALYGLLSTTKPYGTASMWEGRARSDYYLVNMETGEESVLMKGDYARLSFSPTGKYLYWYAVTDSSWYSYSTESQKTFRLSLPETLVAYDEENDMPNHPYPYGVVGWTAEDEQVWIYDRYDIWAFDPQNKKEPTRITQDGRENRRVYRRVRLDKEEKFLNSKEAQWLLSFDEQTKGSGYYRLDPGKQPRQLLGGEYKLSTLEKAQKADKVLFTKETFREFPEVYYTDLRFNKPQKITNVGCQQDVFRWGTTELISFVSLDGDTIEGVIYKPENFDPNRKYPLIVNFYERNAETLHSYRMPSPGRSTVDYHFYNSQDYVIFNPDVHYKEGGYPGQDCYNCVMPGISEVLSRGYIDPKRIAAQGHSWGGYQVAYLATRTNLFACIESGAPVVNMFSAYGGIRWGSGLNRSFQYEHTQSRLGATPWDKPLVYFENSPLFMMDKVNTPILIMHNDEDGHVPWYQGIEYFVALKRLQKPVWLLNYTGEIHWPMRMANRVDFQTRMFQFFEHYLKDKPMPRWMSEGVPAVSQDYDLGY